MGQPTRQQRIDPLKTCADQLKLAADWAFDNIIKNMTLTIAIPDEIAAELGNSEDHVGARVKADLAAGFYEARLVSLGRAAELSGLKRGDFESLLAKRRSIRDYGIEDLDVDLDWKKPL